MKAGDLGKWVLAWLGALICVLAGPAMARTVPVASTCHAQTSLDQRIETLAAASWNCTRNGLDHAPETTFIRFALQPGEAKPVSFVSRFGRYSSLELTAIDRDGTSRTRRYSLDDARPLTTGPYFLLPLPEVTPATTTVIARVNEPWARNILAEAHLSDSPEGEGWPAGAMAALAAITGLLCAPLIFNLAFYHALRERFLLWHFTLVSGMLGQSLISSGLVHYIAEVPIKYAVPANSICFALAVASAALFTADFIEDDKLSARMRNLLRRCAVPSFVICFVGALTIPPLRLVAMNIYYLTMLPMTVLFVAAMAQAAWRGSRMVMFQVIGWTPSIVIGFYRVFTNVSTTAEPSDALLTYNAAIAFEVILTALGVASRFIQMRRERDLARVVAERMRDQAESDALTGLFNRRGIEPRFAELRRSGFTTVAVLDLDHFKRVNDTLGHQAGDQVLAAAALALQPDEDTIALRMGGEEFLLLLRGKDAQSRAEARRQAISQRVSTLVDGLAAPVTASMGMVEFPRSGMADLTFDHAYRRADSLLYEAKRQGRNRTVSEKMVMFERRAKPREAAAA